MSKATLLVLSDSAALAAVAAGILTQAGLKASADRGGFFLALSGGRTPLDLYRRLAEPGFAAPLPWESTTIFFADERCVPADDVRSNYGTVLATGLLYRPLRRVERVLAELGPARAAKEYEKRLLKLVGDPPEFDLIVLGIGSDGHTASLFPGSPVLTEQRILVAATQDSSGLARVTFTLPVLWKARHLLFLAMGRAKANAVAQVIASLRAPAQTAPPAALAAAKARRVTFLLDSDAAALLEEVPAGASREYPLTTSDAHRYQEGS